MSLDNFAMATVEELTLDVGLVTGGECLGYPAPGLISSPRPSKTFQPAQFPPTQSPITMIMCTLLSVAYGLFKPC